MLLRYEPCGDMQETFPWPSRPALSGGGDSVIERAMSRHARRTKPKLPQGDLPDAIASSFADPYDILEQKESIRHLLMATKDITPVLLHAIGYPDVELGKPNVIKVRRHRAKKRLREELGLTAR